MDAATMPRRHGRGRRPFADVQRDVLEAAAAVLLERGLEGFTVDRVIARSGVSPATVYRHWASRGALALDGYLELVGDRVELVDTGDVLADLMRILGETLRLATTTPEGRLLVQLIGAAQTDADLAAAFDEHYFGPRRRDALALLERAAARGALRPGTDLELVIDLAWGACYLRLLMPNLRGLAAPASAAAIAAQALAGAMGTVR